MGNEIIDYKCTENTSLIRELDLNIVLLKKKPFKQIISADLYTSAGGARDKTPCLFYVFRSREVTLGVGSNPEIGF